ncbi:hypothetical protein V8G54_036009 [Vigna mungo]|uniref:Protein kinase domain-containing protein n=1 Tax=Vigna mungo TaxID=3915 RepID=A0AAQ3MG55_VIGMU
MEVSDWHIRWVSPSPVLQHLVPLHSTALTIKWFLPFEFSITGSVPLFSGSSDIHGSNVEFSVREGIDSECSPLLFPGGQILKWPELKVFSFKELKSATENFKSATLVGEGRFGIVYKGWLDEKTLTPAKPGSGVGVAIKMFNTEGTRGSLLCQVAFILISFTFFKLFLMN